MQKKRITSGKAKSAISSKPLIKKTSTPKVKPLPGWAQLLVTVLALYLFAILIFPDNVLEGYDFKFAGDNLAAAPIARMGEQFAEEGKIPNWCPYILGGMPMVGSLLYANHFYPGFALGKILEFLFFGSQYTWLFLHYLLAGLGIFLLLREVRVYWIIAALCGIAFAYNPSMVVYADVGHGSKLMTIAYLPWVLYLTKRLFDHPNPGRSALLALFFGLQLLALHVQIAYYGALIMALYALYTLISERKTGLNKNLKATAYLAVAGILAFCLAAPLYLQVQEYTQFSIRGGGATGGASWDYATQWSFHPLESLTYIFPSFYGFGGETYWGFMPFTDMPLYWGGVILLFVPWALALQRDKLTWFLVILALLAWIISFGKFLPVLFWPLFEFFPYFNKFRVPSLIQVLVLLPVVLLAGRGLQALYAKAVESGEQAKQMAQKIMIAGGAVVGICLLLLILQAALQATFIGWISAARQHLHGGGAITAAQLFNGDLVRLLIITLVVYGAAYIALKTKRTQGLLWGAAVLALFSELKFYDAKLVHPTPPQQMESYLAADDVVTFLQQDKEPYRIFPISNFRNPDWYMAQRIESVMGYTGAKVRLFQEAVDSLTYNNFDFLRLLNVKYLISEQPLRHPAFSEIFVGRQQRIYQFNETLPRTFLVNHAVPVASSTEALNAYRSGEFDFVNNAVIEGQLQKPLDSQAQGSLTWKQRSPDHLALEVVSSGNQLLVLSELYYPSGWTAKLDGKNVPILKCNFLFRAIEIPAGQHQIEMSFQPESAKTGVLLKWIAIVLLVIGLSTLLLPYVKNKAATPKVG